MARLASLLDAVEHDSHPFRTSLPAFLAPATPTGTEMDIDCRSTPPVPLSAVIHSRQPSPSASQHSASDFINSPAEAARSREIEAGKVRLRARLERTGLVEHEVGTDGNCLFRALSHQAHGAEEHHGRLRQAAVAHIRDHEDTYKTTLGSDDDFVKYVSALSTGGFWGDEVALRAVSDSLQWDVVVILSSEGCAFHRYRPTDANSAPPDPRPPTLRTVFLSYLWPIHYNSLLCRDGNAPGADDMDTILARLTSPVAPDDTSQAARDSWTGAAREATANGTATKPPPCQDHRRLPPRWEAPRLGEPQAVSVPGVVARGGIRPIRASLYGGGWQRPRPAAGTLALQLLGSGRLGPNRAFSALAFPVAGSFCLRPNGQAFIDCLETWTCHGNR